MKKYALLLALLGAIQFAHILDFVMMMPLGPGIMADLDVTPQQFAWLISVYTFAAGIVGFGSAFLLDRFDRKHALLLLFAGFIIGTALCGVAGSYTQLLIARTLAGAFGGITGSIVLAIVADVVPADHRGQAMGIITSAFSVASIVGVPLGVWLATLGGWQLPFLLLAGLAAVVWLVAFAAVPAIRGHILAGQASETPVQILRRTSKAPAQLLGMATISAAVLGHFPLVPLLSAYLVRNVGFAQAQLPLVYLVGGILTLVANPFVGTWADKAGKLRVLRILCCTAIPSMLILSNLPAVPLWQALTVMAGFFIFSGTRFIPTMALVSEAAEARFRGSYMAFISCVQQLSSGTASLLAGFIVTEQPGALSPLEHFPIVGLVCVGFTAVGFVVAGSLQQAIAATRLKPLAVEAEVA